MINVHTSLAWQYFLHQIIISLNEYTFLCGNAFRIIPFIPGGLVYPLNPAVAYLTSREEFQQRIGGYWSPPCRAVSDQSPPGQRAIAPHTVIVYSITVNECKGKLKSRIKHSAFCHVVSQPLFVYYISIRRLMEKTAYGNVTVNNKKNFKQILSILK